MFDGQRTTQKFPRQVGAQLSRNGVQVGRIFVRVFKSRSVQWMLLKVQLASGHVVHIISEPNESRTTQNTQTLFGAERNCAGTLHIREVRSNLSVGAQMMRIPANEVFR